MIRKLLCQGHDLSLATLGKSEKELGRFFGKYWFVSGLSHELRFDAPNPPTKASCPRPCLASASTPFFSIPGARDANGSCMRLNRVVHAASAARSPALTGATSCGEEMPPISRRQVRRSPLANVSRQLRREATLAGCVVRLRFTFRNDIEVALFGGRRRPPCRQTDVRL
jgi:hypothetical protein